MAAIAYPATAFEREEFEHRGRRPVRRPVAPASITYLPNAGVRRRASADVYRRRRVAALVLAAVLGAALILFVRAAAGALGGAPLAPPAPSAADGAVQPAAAVSYVVQPGDTYWSIVAKAHPSGDMRAAVDRLVASRHGAPLRAGESILLP